MYNKCNKHNKQITKTSKMTKTICCTNKCRNHTENVKNLQTIIKHVQTCNKHTKQMTKTSKHNKNNMLYKQIQNNIQEMTKHLQKE